ncbi:MAG: DUF305 domain-containing protein [Sporichthyaceae bacterium]
MTDDVAQPPQPRRRAPLLAVVFVVVMLATAVGVAAGMREGRAEPPPSDGAAAGFSRDMQTHHAQAVRMAMVVRDRTANPEIRTLAYDIALSQQQQVGQMFGWLNQWGLSQTGDDPELAWIPKTPSGAPGHGGHSTGTGGMPGMASPEDVAALEGLSGPAAERRFLELMIAHHRGGVAMAQALLDLGAPNVVEVLARSIVTAQAGEIEVMTDLLSARGGETQANPAPASSSTPTPNSVPTPHG